MRIGFSWREDSIGISAPAGVANRLNDMDLFFKVIAVVVLTVDLLLGTDVVAVGRPNLRALARASDADLSHAMQRQLMLSSERSTCVHILEYHLLALH
jgi:hypothetical protein